MISFSLKDYRPYRLVLAEGGRHRFGGPPEHNGVVPSNTNTPLHLFLSLDLSDPNCPIKADRPVLRLPLYYPLKYGTGGGAAQYAVLSDTEIKLLYMSDGAPDDEDREYIHVAALPTSQASLIPMTYEESRIVGFRKVDGYFQPNAADSAILDHLDYNNFVAIGGIQELHANAGDIICRNPLCGFYNRRVYFEIVAVIPPIKVNGSHDFWYQWQGVDEFIFGFCRYCGTVLAFNCAS